MDKLLSVVVSVYNEELALREFYLEAGRILNALPSPWTYELLFINDGSVFLVCFIYGISFRLKYPNCISSLQAKISLLLDSS